MEQQIQKLIELIDEKFSPVSVFLYGSRGRGDFIKNSDYEIGVLYSNDKIITRQDLLTVNTLSNAVLYPFEYENFIQYKIDTPFPENIYFRELILGGKTLRGRRIIEELKPPQITTLDLLQRVRFDLGFALAAVLSYRNKDFATARSEFLKSCLFGVRCLLVLEEKTFPLGYNEIYEVSKKLELGEYAEVVQHAIDVRGSSDLQSQYLYKNISLLNLVVKKQILDNFNKMGSQVVLD